MNGFLLDTNCISETVRPQPNPGLFEWMDQSDPASHFVSVLTLGEIRKGVANLLPGRKRAQLETWLDVELRARFRHRVLPVDEAIADRWGFLETQARRFGKPLPAIDSLLAATAIEHHLTLVTRNTRDFAAAHVSVFNPWT